MKLKTAGRRIYLSDTTTEEQQLLMINGARYNKTEKSWTLPVTHLEEVTDWIENGTPLFLKNHRKGSKWTLDEDEQLEELYTESHLSLEDIASEHGRTELAIKYRLFHIALKKKKQENMSLKEVADFYNLELSDLQKFELEQKRKKSNNNQKNNLDVKNDTKLDTSPEAFMKVLLEIRDSITKITTIEVESE